MCKATTAMRSVWQGARGMRGPVEKGQVPYRLSDIVQGVSNLVVIEAGLEHAIAHPCHQCR